MPFHRVNRETSVNFDNKLLLVHNRIYLFIFPFKENVIFEGLKI